MPFIVGARYRIEGTETIGRLMRLEWDPITRREFGILQVSYTNGIDERRIETRSLLGPRSYTEAVEALQTECSALVNKWMKAPA